MRFLLIFILLTSIQSFAQDTFVSPIAEDGFSFSVIPPEGYKQFEIEEEELYYFSSDKEITIDEIDEGKFADGMMILLLESAGESAEEMFEEMVEEATYDGDVKNLTEKSSININGQEIFRTSFKVESEDIPIENMLMSATEFGENVVFIMFVGKSDEFDMELLFEEVWESWHLIQSN